MTLPSGRTLGPYEIVSLIGAGGMGEVYRARDRRLDRIVAIKVLPSALGAKPELRERFEREARAISALSHPAICALYDLGHDDGLEYLVMEYLEGESLAERISRGPLPASQLLRYGEQIADALQSAHRAGITHRDLKPGNIMLTATGAKLLDFGLAKFVEAEGRIFSADSAPATRLGPLTAEGTIVGTYQYMSPEQLECRTVDHRSDLFALGVILYEMATGQRPFRGDSPASVIAAVLSSDPAPIRTLQPAAPPALERIIHTALEKKPDDRWQTAHDIGRQLRWIHESSLTTESTAAAPRRARSLPLAAIVAITAIAAALLTWGATRLIPAKASRSGVIRLQFAPPPGMPMRHSPDLSDFAISPDGASLVFASTGGTPGALFLRRLDSYDVHKVEGSEGAMSPFWSSDSRWIGYTANGKLWKTRAAGGAPPQVIGDAAASGARASWNGRTILFSDWTRKEIYRISSDGGVPVRVTTVRPGEWRHTWPAFLGDGRHFLYLSQATGSLDRQLRLASLDSPAESVLATNVSFARVLGDDDVLYVRDGKLLSQQVDVAKGKAIGETTAIANDIESFYVTARADFDASRSGVLVYRTDTSTARLVQRDRKGVETRLVDDQELFWDHALSPDGRKAAVTVENRATGLMDIWIYDLARGIRDRFTSEPAMEVSPAWSPDGRSIIYAQGDGGSFPHLVRRAIGAATSEEIVPAGDFQFSPAFSPDGATLYYESDSQKMNVIGRRSLKTGATDLPVHSGFNEGQPSVSPDGRWLAFTCTASGAYEVYVQSLAGDGSRIRISTRGGLSPHWRGDSKELFYVSPERAIVSVVPGPRGGWEDATTAELFRVPSRVRGFDVTPDGSSFLISDWTPGAADDLYHVVVGLKEGQDTGMRNQD
jgi:serine/threonine protein kinase/Tol biopolymer transport system component